MQIYLEGAVACVHTIFDCKHEQDVEVALDTDIDIPASVRGLGRCPACRNNETMIPVGGVAPRAGGRLVLDSIMMMPIEG